MADPRFALSPDIIDLQQDTRRFAIEKLRPRAAALEWEPNPLDRVAWDLVEEASTHGWRTMGLPRRDGGGEASVLALCVLAEELAYGDMGFAVMLDQTLKVQRIIARLAGAELRERFLRGFLNDPRAVLAICFTEPETGSDYIIPKPDFHFQTRAERASDGSWILNGYKHFISNGADAAYYLVFASTDWTKRADRGTSAFLLEPGHPGFEVETIHEKISQRCINNAALRFSNVTVEPWRMVGPEHRGYAGSREILRESAIEAGATTLGTARAAYELAVERARTRVQGGAALIDHANVACRIAQMYSQLEAARSLVWRAAWAVEHDPDYDYRLGSAAKTVAADVAVEVCLSALEIFGGLGVMMREAAVEKCLRDCLSFLHSDGAQDSHRIRIAQMIRDTD